jgi:hypothetical protein
MRGGCRVTYSRKVKRLFHQLRITVHLEWRHCIIYGGHGEACIVSILALVGGQETEFAQGFYFFFRKDRKF